MRQISGVVNYLLNLLIAMRYESNTQLILMRVSIYQYQKMGTPFTSNSKYHFSMHWTASWVRPYRVLLLFAAVHFFSPPEVWICQSSEHWQIYVHDIVFSLQTHKTVMFYSDTLNMLLKTCSLHFTFSAVVFAACLICSEQQRQPRTVHLVPLSTQRISLLPTDQGPGIEHC